jgi:hypothetical protein
MFSKNQLSPYMETYLDPDTESVEVFWIRWIGWHITAWFDGDDIACDQCLASEMRTTGSDITSFRRMIALTDCFDRRWDSHAGHCQDDVICNGDTINGRISGCLQRGRTDSPVSFRLPLMSA